VSPHICEASELSRFYASRIVTLSAYTINFSLSQLSNAYALKIIVI